MLGRHYICISIQLMAFQVSNETKVGALAAVAITFLVLGYNFLAGKGSLFSNKFELQTLLHDVNEINTSTPILLNGYKVGNVNEIEMSDIQGQFKVFFIINEKLSIPEDSKIQVKGTLLNGKSLNLILGTSSKMAHDESILASIADTSIMESVSGVMKPLSNKITSIVNSLDSLLASNDLKNSISSLNKSLISFKRTSDNASELLEANVPKLTAILGNVESITTNLKNNNQSIALIISNLKATTDNLAAAKLKETVDKANDMLYKLDQVMGKINTGEGSLGLLVNDPALYTNLNKVAVDLDTILKDLNKHPAKYIPIPFTKKQRKKAIEASQQSTP